MVMAIINDRIGCVFILLYTTFEVITITITIIIIVAVVLYTIHTITGVALTVHWQ